jgi:23S rRNA (adenine2503-C2)-methyltransferase
MLLSNILALTKEELSEKFKELGLESFRAKQVWNWLYVKGVKNFDEMNNVSKAAKEILNQNFSITYPQISHDHISKDGTRKWLVKFFDGKEVETVFIPEETRGTLCISSQVGCTLACKFCYTGTQLFVRNLTADEIVGQVLIARELLRISKQNDLSRMPELASGGATRSSQIQTKGLNLITNIVFMGMGEPFYNYENVAKAVKILNDMDGLALSGRKITISTSGLVPEILQCAKELKTTLAISLHAPNDELRTQIMAINKRYPLADLIAACREYCKINAGQKITFEYVMLKDVNDKPEHAVQLVNLLRKANFPSKVNLIPFNSWMGCGYEKSDKARIDEFWQIVKKAGIIITTRKTRGDDVSAACGQLKSESKRNVKVRN